MSDELLRTARSRLALAVVLALFAAGSLGLVYWLHDMDWATVRQASPGALLLILALTVLGTLTYTLLICVLIRGSGYAAAPGRAYLVLTASLSANYVTPVKAGIPLRIYLYGHFMGIPAAAGAVLVSVEMLVGMLTPAFIAIAGAALLFPALGLAPPLLLVALLLAGLLFVLRAPLERLRPGVERLPCSPFTARLVRFAGQVQTGLRSLSPTVILGVAALDLAMLGLQTARLWLVLSVLGPVPSPLALLAVLTISVTAGNLSLVPMGLGVRDASFTWLLVQLGVPGEIALSAAVIQRLFAPGWPLLLGLISTNILGISEIANRSEQAPTQEEAAHDRPVA